MSDKDEIKELFQRELGNYKAKVDPSLWQGVQSGISAGTSAAATSIGVGAKVVIGIVSVAAISVASYVIYNVVSNDADIAQEKPSQQEQIIEKTDEKSQQEQINTNEEVPSLNDNVEKKSEDKNTEVDNESIPEEVKKNNSSNSPIARENGNSETINTKDEGSYHQDNAPEENTDDVVESTNKESTTPVKNIEKKDETKDIPIKLALEPKIVSQNNQYVKFDVNTKNIDEIVWDFGDGNFSTSIAPEHFYDESGTYDVVVTGRNGDREIKKSLSVVIDIEGELLKLPNIFTPNGDGSSDYLFVESKGIKEFQITIMNNKQEVVFKSNDAAFRWDGTMQNGIPAPEGNYVYIIIAKDNQGNTLNKYQQLRISR